MFVCLVGVWVFGRCVFDRCVFGRCACVFGGCVCVWWWLLYIFLSTEASIRLESISERVMSREINISLSTRNDNDRMFIFNKYTNRNKIVLKL